MDEFSGSFHTLSPHSAPPSGAVLDKRGRSRKGLEFLQRSGGIAAGLGAIHQEVLPFAMWMRNVELVPV